MLVTVVLCVGEWRAVYILLIRNEPWIIPSSLKERLYGVLIYKRSFYLGSRGATLSLNIMNVLILILLYKWSLYLGLRSTNRSLNRMTVCIEY